MEFFPCRAWQIIPKLEKILGIWPYQIEKPFFLLLILYILVFISFSIPVGLRLKNEIGFNRDIVIENALLEILLGIMLVKLVIPFLTKTKRQQLYEMIAMDWKTMTDKKEKEILEQFSNVGYKLTIIYITIIGADVCLYHGIPIVKMFVNYYMDANQTELVKVLSFYVEYNVDQDKYYALITLHAGIIGGLTFLILFTHDMAFIMSVQHVCALFQIISLHFGKVSEILKQHEDGLINFAVADAIIFKHISNAITVHNLAFRRLQIVENAYKITWFIVSLANTLGFGGVTFIIVLCLDRIDDVIRYVITLVALLIHFYFIFLPGQKVIDHSGFVFDICYSCDWYKLSKKSKVLIRIMMIRSLRCSYLTGGGMIILCMPVYGAMLKAGFSYFTVFAVT